MRIRDLPFPLTPDQVTRRHAWAKLLGVPWPSVPRKAALVLLPEECPDTADGNLAYVRAMMEKERQWELTDCENTILREIGDRRLHRRDISQTYALILMSSEAQSVDWGLINRAIIARWSESALQWIKERAWNGRCWA